MSNLSQAPDPAAPLRVVITPDLLGEALADPALQPVLELWRDGSIQPVVSRMLLVRYFRLLNRLGLPERLIRWWGWWLGSPAKSMILTDPPLPIPLNELCRTLALAAEAPYVVSPRDVAPPHDATASPQPGPRWISPIELQAVCRKNDALA